VRASTQGTLRRRKAIILVVICTLLGAAAQLLLKVGSATVQTDSLFGIFWSMAANLPLVAGLSLYGLSTVLFIYALRNEQLSLLYPLISLTYIWVTIVSVVILGESLSWWKVSGVLVIVSGVALLGMGDES
jgi:drug/metabolite transporter (DMT)-like permease